MRNFSWNYFRNTGNIDAYLLYREYEAMLQEEENEISIENIEKE